MNKKTEWPMNYRITLVLLNSMTILPKGVESL